MIGTQVYHFPQPLLRMPTQVFIKIHIKQRRQFWPLLIPAVNSFGFICLATHTLGLCNEHKSRNQKGIVLLITLPSILLEAMMADVA